MGHNSARTPASVRRRALLATGAAVALALAAQVPQEATTAAEPSASAKRDAAAARSAAATPRAATSSFLGGREWDEGSDVEVDGAGSSYVTGFTLSEDFPVAGAAQDRFAGLADGFVTKVAADGRRVWSTYLGGIDLDVPTSLAMDLDGNVYVTGRTGSPDFPTTDDAHQARVSGNSCQGEPCHDAFVTKISPAGRVVYSTLLGGSANEEGVGIAVDRRGRAWVTGNTDSTDLPLERPLQEDFQSPPCPRGGIPCEYDAFVSLLSADGERLLFSSYLGGDSSEFAGGIAVDGAGSAYVTGTTRSADFPVTGGALQSRITGLECGPPPGAPCLDAFVTKVENMQLAYSTYVGGSSDERSSGIAVDRAGRAVITGSTRSANLPLRRAVQTGLDNASCTSELPEEHCDDAFVTQLTADGGALVYSTYLGGEAEDQGLAVTVDATGDTHVAGRTDSRDFPVQRAAQRTFGGYIDGFAAQLAARTGALVTSTFIGGEEADRVTGVDTHDDGTVHLTGRTLSPDFPTQKPFQRDMAAEDDYDAFVRTHEPASGAD